LVQKAWAIEPSLLEQLSRFEVWSRRRTPSEAAGWTRLAEEERRSDALRQGTVDQVCQTDAVNEYEPHPAPALPGSLRQVYGGVVGIRSAPALHPGKVRRKVLLLA
jgi:hypothetical protein